MSDTNPVLNLTWVTAPPIRVIPEGEVPNRVRALKAAMQGWNPVPVPASPGPQDIDARDWKTPQRTQQERWNTRLGAMNTMFQTMEITGDAFTGHAVEYVVAGIPVGILMLELDSPPAYIEDLIAHPGSAECGGILLEYAVNKAQQDLGDPRIKLFPLDDEAQQAYLHLGFRVFMRAKEPSKVDHMLLDPANSGGVWTQVSNTWRLTRYQNSTRYLA